MDSLLWPVTLLILPTDFSGGTSLSLTFQKSAMVSQCEAGVVMETEVALDCLSQGVVDGYACF